MLRSLYSGITGLGANAVEMDVIGNNIANANTAGYKGSRVTFREMYSQTISGASRPVSGQRGGVNPMQVGLGTSVGTIDTRFNQGALLSTGLVNDLALQGDGFFMLSDGTDTVYSRAGAFGLDADHYLVDPGTGLRLQGVMADEDGTITPGAWEDLRIDPSMSVPASATANLQLFGNLDSDAEDQGSILESRHLMAAAAGADTLTGLYSQDGGAMGVLTGDRIALTGMVDTGGTATSISTSTFLVGSTVPGEGGSTVDELLAWMTTQLEALPEFNPGEITLTLGADGAVTIDNGSGAATLLNLKLNIPGNSEFNGSFSFDSTVAPGGSGTTADAAAGQGQLRAAATSDDLLTEVFNSRGESLGLNVDALNPETVLALTGSVGSGDAPGYNLTVDATTTVEGLMTGLQIAMGLSSEPVSLNSAGELVLQGELGRENALGQVAIREVGEVNPTLETSFSFAEIQAADDGETYTVSSAVYDSLGDLHTVRFTFTKRVGMNEWTWQAEMEGTEEILEGGSGTVSFDENGDITAFRYADDAGQISFRPQAGDEEGADVVSLQVDAGQLGSLDGMTQYASAGTLQSVADGYAAGDLLDYEIDMDGTVIGRFSNDTLHTIARVGIARFANNGGLLQDDGNTFKVSSNSGTAMTGFAGGDGGTLVVSGALEGSNVDITAELTNLVVAQRAFQANARVVTTGDQILQEIVSILR